MDACVNVLNVFYVHHVTLKSSCLVTRFRLQPTFEEVATQDQRLCSRTKAYYMEGERSMYGARICHGVSHYLEKHEFFQTYNGSNKIQSEQNVGLIPSGLNQ